MRKKSGMLKSRKIVTPIPPRPIQPQPSENELREKLLKFFAMLDAPRQTIVVDLAVSLKRDLDRAQRLRLPAPKLGTPIPKRNRK